MNLISINVSIPRLVIINGVQVATGIFKLPVAGPVRVYELNLEGDRQADLTVHGGQDKAAYAYPAEHLDFWKNELGREDLGPGSFGENLTVQGLSEEEVAIGDEFEMGSAQFIVTEPRLPCYKLAFALDTPTIGKTFMESGRSGFYLRVLRPGTIEAENEIRPLSSREQARVTIAEFLKVFNLRQATHEQLTSILSLQALPEGWKDSLRRKVEVRE